MDPLLIFSIILIGGMVGGWLAQKFHVPSITGNILAGVLIGPSVLGVVAEETSIEQLRPLSTFAMGLIVVAIGAHLSYRRIHNALRRILSIAILEVLVCLAFVFLAVYWIAGDVVLALLLGSLALSTAPGTNLAIVRESRGKGSYVKTLLSVVALDNILAIAFFAFAQIVVADYYEAGLQNFSLARALLHPVALLIGSLAFGLALGKATEWAVVRHSFHSFSTIFVAILLCTGLAKSLGLSPLLTSLFFGVYLGNSSRVVEEQIGALAPIEGLVYTIFFTLAGVTLHFNMLGQLGLLGVVFLVTRALGKSVGAMLGGVLSGSSRRIWVNIPLGLIPQAGVVIGLLVIMQSNPAIPREMTSLVTTLVLAAVVLNEIIGPLTSRLGLQRAKEVNKDRRRLIEFMHEEFIKTDLKATDKWDALRQLCDFLVQTHRVDHVDPDELYRTVVEREKSESTAIGHGVAIPHGILDSGPAIQGVLGVFSEGLDYDAPDGRPVNIVMLIATPQDHRRQHLQVMASLAAMVSDEVLRSRLVSAANANEAWEVIEEGETPTYNYFLED